MQEGGAGNVGRVGRQAAIVRGVNALRQRVAFSTGVAGPAAGGDVVGDGRHEGGLAQARHQLLADRLLPQVDVVQVDGGRIGRTFLPQVGDGARQQAQHAAHALELAQGGGLASQGRQHVRVEGVADREILRGLRTGGFLGQRFALFPPERLVGVDDLALAVVHALEQAAQQHRRRLGVLRGVQERRLAGGDAHRLGHGVRDELVLLAVGVRGAAIPAHRQRVHQRRVRRALHRFEQGREKRRELLRRALAAPHLAQIHGQLVQEDQRGFAAEQCAQRLGAGRHALLVAAPHALVAGAAGKRVGDLAPRGVGQDAIAEVPAIGRIRVFAVKGGDAHGAGRQPLGIDELARVRHALHAAGGVQQGDQAVGLAAAVGGVQPEDGCRLSPAAAQARADVRQQVAQPAGGIGVGEKPRRLRVRRACRASDHGREIRREVRIRHAPRQHVRARLAEVENGGQGGCHLR